MNAHLNSVVWFFAGTLVGVLVTLVIGVGTHMLGLAVFGPLVIPVGVPAFLAVTIIASRATSERHRYLLSVATGILYPGSMYAIGRWCDTGRPMQLPFPILIVLLLAISFLCESVLFGAGWLLLYGPKYYRDNLAP